MAALTAVKAPSATEAASWRSAVASGRLGDAQTVLAAALRLADPGHDAREAAILELASLVLRECAKHSLKPQQAADALGMALRVLRVLTRGPDAGTAATRAAVLLRDSLLAAVIGGAQPEDETGCMDSFELAQELPTLPQQQQQQGQQVQQGQEQQEQGQQQDQQQQALPAHVAKQLAAVLARELLAHSRLWRHLLLREQAHAAHTARLPLERAVCPQPLANAVSEVEHAASGAADAARAAAEAAAAEAAAAAAAAEAAAAEEAASRASEEAARAAALALKPHTLGEAVDLLVAQHLEGVRQGLAAEHATRSAALAARVAQLEAAQLAVAAHASSGGGGGGGGGVQLQGPRASATVRTVA